MYEMECMEEICGDSINFWLIRLIHNYSAVNYKKFRNLGIHPGQLPVLKKVYEEEGISLKGLANAVHIKPPTVTVTIQRLEKAGLVYKKPDAEDQRVSRIYLTEKGKDLQMEIARLIHENEQLLTGGFSAEEMELLRSYFKRMVENLQQESISRETIQRMEGKLREEMYEENKMVIM